MKNGRLALIFSLFQWSAQLFPIFPQRCAPPASKCGLPKMLLFCSFSEGYLPKWEIPKRNSDDKWTLIWNLRVYRLPKKSKEYRSGPVDICSHSSYTAPLLRLSLAFRNGVESYMRERKYITLKSLYRNFQSRPAKFSI